MQRLSAAGDWERYIFSRQVKPDRLQLLPIPRPLSLSSKNTATTKAQIRSGSIANIPPICRQSLFLLLLSIGYWALGLCPLAFLLGLFAPRQQRIPLAIPPAQPLLSLILITAEP